MVDSPMAGEYSASKLATRLPGVALCVEDIGQLMDSQVLPHIAQHVVKKFRNK